MSKTVFWNIQKKNGEVTTGMVSLAEQGVDYYAFTVAIAVLTNSELGLRKSKAEYRNSVTTGGCYTVRGNALN